jgi:putative membrane protein
MLLASPRVLLQVTMERNMRINKLVAALSMAVLGACAKGDKSEYDSTGTTTDTTAAASATATPATTTPALTDANIAALLDEANMADSANGKIASTKGSNADVKAFGVLMMNDHHALRKQGQDLVKKLNVTPEPPASDSLPAKAKMLSDSLTSMKKGAAWDNWYIDHEVMMHQDVLNLIDQASSAAQAPELKDLLSKARPNIEMHLKRAQDIQGKLGATATDSTPKTP